MRKIIEECIQESIDMKTRLKGQAPVIERIVRTIIDAYTHGNKVLIFGNGGSAGDAQHIAGELVGRFFKERAALPCIALHANSSIVTAIANDYGYDVVFKRQVEANLKRGDVVIGISTSGNSQNVLQALEYANEHGGITIGFTGENKCKMDDISNIVLKIPSNSTPRIQEGHITAGHIICYLVEKEMFG